MSIDTKIEWCDSSVNPIAGCSGCELWNKESRTCYAGLMTDRFKGAKGFPTSFDEPQAFPGRIREAAGWSDLTGKARVKKPWLSGHPRFIFVSDMGDIMSHPDRDFFRTDVISGIFSHEGQRHTWVILTKRANEMAKRIHWLRTTHGLILPSNIIWGVSVTDQATVKRLDTLLAIPNVRRMVSIEPLLGPVDLRQALRTAQHDLDWCIAGALSGVPDTAIDLDWYRSIRDTCATFGVPFFLKQFADAQGNHLSVPALDGNQHTGVPANEKFASVQ